MQRSVHGVVFLLEAALIAAITGCGGDFTLLPQASDRKRNQDVPSKAAADGGGAPPAAQRPAPPPSVVSAPPVVPPAPVPPSPPPKPDWQVLYEDGVASYEKGAYGNAIRKLREVADNSQADDETRLKALKLMAFSYCVSPGPKAANLALCRQTFERALKTHPTFELAPGERGHPIWGKEFEAAKRALAPQPRTEDAPAGKPLSASSVVPARLSSSGKSDGAGAQ